MSIGRGGLRQGGRRQAWWLVGDGRWQSAVEDRGKRRMMQQATQALVPAACRLFLAAVPAACRLLFTAAFSWPAGVRMHWGDCGYSMLALCDSIPGRAAGRPAFRVFGRSSPE